jgi:threonylcarbamoyladenosine tRNA methylthiotransferase MtaB
MKYSVITFGCRVNQADSLAIEGQLRARGAEASPPGEADLLVVNTCSVTATADQGARQTIRRIVRSNPHVRVVVTGCYATRRPDELAALPNVATVVHNDDKDDLVARLDIQGDGPCGRLTPGIGGRTALTLRVQTGCEEHCSYCVIPQTRGTGRSRPLRLVIEDIHRAVAAGYREIAITGVHLGSYGRDLGDGCSLTTLVRLLAEWDADILFRISSLEPMDCSLEIVDLVASSARLAPHFHLPLQHGCDEMLRRMRRPYSSSYYRELVGRIRDRLPHASIGTDLIAGFPGETDAAFRHCSEFVQTLPLSHVHVFPYSDRPGTPASAMTDKVDGAATRERGRQLRAIGARLARAFHASQAGTRRRALTVDDGWSAVTDNYFKIRLPVQQPRNEWVEVIIGGPSGREAEDPENVEADVQVRLA